MGDAAPLIALLFCGIILVLLIETLIMPRLRRRARRRRHDPMAGAHGDAPFNPWTDRHG
jgi:hypothetical protein